MFSIVNYNKLRSSLKFEIFKYKLSNVCRFVLINVRREYSYETLRFFFHRYVLFKLCDLLIKNMAVPCIYLCITVVSSLKTSISGNVSTTSNKI